MSHFIHTLAEALTWISYFNTLVFLPTNILVVWKTTSNMARCVQLLEEQLRNR